MTNTDWQPQIEETIAGFLDTLTGFDEIAIARSFEGLVPYTDMERRPIETARALIFVQKRRDGLTDTEAKQAVLGMPFGEVNGFFAPDEDEAIDSDDQAATPAGEGDAAAA